MAFPEHDNAPICGLDIGGTKMAATVAGPDGPLARLTAPVARTGSSRALPEQAIAVLEAASARAGIDPRQARRLGVASCGPFTCVDGRLELAAPNLCGGLAPHRADGASSDLSDDLPSDLPNDWCTIPLEQVLRERFDDVTIDNDCVAALVAERRFGALRDVDDCAYATWSTGIGFGLCVDGQVLRGKHGNAGHAGHMLLDPGSSARCGCGNFGDAEALASGRNVGLRAGRPGPELFAAARAGEPASRAMVETAAAWFGRVLYNLVVTLDLRRIAIGGSVWTHNGDWLAPAVMREIDSRLPALTAGATLCDALLGDRVVDIGALSLAMPAAWVERWQASQPWQVLGIEA
ncbi:MAG: ROK family protein [Burkholderiaceae bacterium]